MWGRQRWRADRPPCWGSWEGMRSVQAAGWQWGGVGTMGSDCLPRLGTPPGFGVFIPTVYLWQGLTPPFPQQVLPPRWQLWSCPCDQGHSLGVLSGYRHRTPGGTDPPTQLPSPLLSKSKSLLPVSIPWTPAAHALCVPTGPGGQCRCPCPQRLFPG